MIINSAQLELLFNGIHRRYSLGDVWLQIKKHWKEDLPDFMSDKNVYFTEIFDKLRETYPQFAAETFTCSLCSVGAYSGCIYFIKYHEGDAFSSSVSKQCCDYCRRSMFAWRDGYLHNRIEPRISKYHSGDRETLYKHVNFSDPTIMGMEIETYINGDRRHVYTTAKVIEDMGGVIAEEDGSLDREHGVEFIFPPTTLDKVTPDCKIAKVLDYLRHNGGLGWDAGRGYGIHISLNAAKMTRLHCAKLCYFLNKNTDLCEFFGGRPESRFFECSTGRLSVAGHVNENKYLAAARRSKQRIEIRIFRSSLFWPRIRRNFEFVHAVREYTKHASSQKLNKENFIEFLKDESCCKIYRNVRSLLGLNGKKAPSKEVVMSCDF